MKVRRLIVAGAVLAAGVTPIFASAQSASARRRCTPGYWNPCLKPASDYDCAGGSGNGPKYVYGIVHDKPSKDIYDLDADNDGIGCE
ncbi:MAG: hypothetical protein M3290_01510 [Actinomycetota bacterium]|nr:hypothetical protein [Actinomycetota bacterium]